VVSSTVLKGEQVRGSGLMMSAAVHLLAAASWISRLSGIDIGGYLHGYPGSIDRSTRHAHATGAKPSRGRPCVRGAGIDDQRCRRNQLLIRFHQWVTVLPWRARSALLTVWVPSWRSWASSCSTSWSIWSTS
jgi:hypothetical protein